MWLSSSGFRRESTEYRSPDQSTGPISPPSMIGAIETLAEVPATGRKLAVIGEMRELGEQSPEGHRSVGEALAKARPDKVLFVGPATEAAQQAAMDHGLHGTRMAADIQDVTAFLRGLQRNARVESLRRLLHGSDPG